MATVNISALFENNLRRVSEVGVTTLFGQLASDGNRLGTSPIYAKGGDSHLSYNIPADSFVPKFYIIVDEAFDAGTTLAVSTIKDGLLVGDAIDLAVPEASLGVLNDTYFPVQDGVSLVINQDVTTGIGKVRVICEYLSGETNNGAYVGDGGAL